MYVVILFVENTSNCKLGVVKAKEERDTAVKDAALPRLSMFHLYMHILYTNGELIRAALVKTKNILQKNKKKRHGQTNQKETESWLGRLKGRWRYEALLLGK